MCCSLPRGVRLPCLPFVVAPFHGSVAHNNFFSTVRRRLEPVEPRWGSTSPQTESPDLPQVRRIRKRRRNRVQACRCNFDTKTQHAARNYTLLPNQNIFISLCSLEISDRIENTIISAREHTQYTSIYSSGEDKANLWILSCLLSSP
jgi:hypothetical protein